jgi:hypothetical protein
MIRLRVLLAASALLVAVPVLIDPASASHKAVYACNDGIDNDADGVTDYPDDSACIGPYDTSANSRSAAMGSTTTVMGRLTIRLTRRARRRPTTSSRTFRSTATATMGMTTTSTG